MYVNKLSLEALGKTFKASKRMCIQSRAVKKDMGLLGINNHVKAGRSIPEETKEKVLAFYENDEFTRMMPGSKDVVSAQNSAGVKVYKSQRLLLCNNNILHEEFLKKFPEQKIGKSKFAELKPKWVKTANANGSHSVCVCTYYQNTKFMVDKMNDYTYHDLMGTFVCDMQNRNCALGRCQECPGKETLKENITSKLSDKYEEDDTIQYRQRVTTDRCTIETKVLDREACVEILIEKVIKLVPHHYISKAQSAYCTKLKEELQMKWLCC